MTDTPPITPVEKIRSALTSYRVLAWMTGIWLIALCYELILKYVVKVENPPEWISIVHGWVYFVYLLFTANLAVKVRWGIAKTIGVAALRYADLSSNRTMDYTFSWEKLLAFEGNTAPYLLYAVVRVRSIFRKTGLAVGQGEDGASDPETPTEIALARKLLAFTAALDQALEELRPHHLCTYLHELASAYGAFYAADSVLVDDPAVKARRLMLCARTAAIMETGLRLLGIEPLERM